MSVDYKDVEEHFWKLYERRHELLMVVVTSVIVACLVNILSPFIVSAIENAVTILGGLKILAWSTIILLLLLCMIAIGYFYYGKPVTFSFVSFLLINNENGLVYPIRPPIEFTLPASNALREYLKENEVPLFSAGIPHLKDELLRDLLEVLLVDWLISATHFKAELITSYTWPQVRFPKIGKKMETLRAQSILAKFGENRFAKYLDKVIMPQELKIPKALHIKAIRYENERVNFGSNAEDQDGSWIPFGSELQIEGSKLTPLRKFRILTCVSKIAPGDRLFLLALGFRPTVIGPDRIECVNQKGEVVTIQGEELKDLKPWVEVDYNIVISVEFRPWLYLHPRFGEIINWARRLTIRAKDYFAPASLFPAGVSAKVSGV